MYVDGGLASPLPIAVARSFGADVIIAVDVLYPPEDSELGGLPSTVFQTLLIQMQRIKAFEIVDADVVIAPDMHTAGGFSFTDRLSLVQAGEAAALAAMPAIRAAISRGGSTARVASCRGR